MADKFTGLKQFRQQKLFGHRNRAGEETYFILVNRQQ